MRSPAKLLTARGWALLLIGIAGAIASMAYGQRDLLWIGLLVAMLPLVAMFTVARSGLHLRAERSITPARGTLGERLVGRLRLTNSGSFPLSVLQFEESVPRELGRRPRFTVHTLKSSWQRTLEYPMTGMARGRYTVGPLLVRATDPFGLARLDRRFSATTSVLVTPRVVPLSDMSSAPGAGQTGESTPLRIGLVGQDDVLVREYRDGDDVRRIHWRSTAKRGEIMVRREEQSWDPSLTVLLDSRRQAHAGNGPDSSFEWAVSAVASIAKHMQAGSFTLRLVDADGMLVDTTNMDPGVAQDAVLLALTETSTTTEDADLHLATEVVNLGKGGEMLVAVMGRLSPAEVGALTTMRERRSQGLALVMDVDTYTARRFRATPEEIEEHHQCVKALTDANWRVVSVAHPQTVDEAWQALDRIGATL